MPVRVLGKILGRGLDSTVRALSGPRRGRKQEFGNRISPTVFRPAWGIYRAQKNIYGPGNQPMMLSREMYEVQMLRAGHVVGEVVDRLPG